MELLKYSTQKEGKMSRKDAGVLGWLKTKNLHKASFEKRINEYNKNPKKCLNCSNILSYNKRYGKFCNHVCSATYNNFQRGKKKKNCISCNVIFYPKAQKTKYCSIKCQAQFQNNKIINEWKNDKRKGYNGKTMQVSPWLRKYLFKKFNCKCCKCGWNEINKFTNKIPLEVNHIDGDASNSKEENLELVCPNCHSLTHNFRSLNKNSKRKRKKPQEGFEPTKDY